MITLLPIEEEIEFCDGHYLRTTIFREAGTIGEQHRHHFNHDTQITRGAASLWIEGVWEGDYREGDLIFIQAMLLHHFIALEPDTRITCIWPEDIDMDQAIVRH